MHGIVADEAIVDVESRQTDVGHRTDAARVLEIKSGQNFLHEFQRIAECRRIFVVGVQQIGSEVVIGVAVAVGVFLVEHDSDVRGIVAAIARLTADAEVRHRVGLVLVDAVGAEITLFFRVERRIINLVFEHRLGHFVNRDFHRCQRIAVEIRVEQAQFARVGDNLPVDAADDAVGLREEFRIVFEHVELGHEIARDVGVGLGIFDFAEIARRRT